MVGKKKSDEQSVSHNAARDAMTTKEKIEHKEKMCRTSFSTNEGHRFRPLKFPNDIWIRAVKIDNENFYMLSDIFFAYGRTTTPHTDVTKKTFIAIEKLGQTEAKVMKVGKGKISVGNWLAVRIFLDIYKPYKKGRNTAFKAVFDGEDIYPCKKIATTDTGTRPPLHEILKKSSNTVLPILLESIKANKNIASIVKILENGGIKHFMNEALDSDISGTLQKYFDQTTAGKLEETNFYDWGNLTVQEISILTNALKGKLPINNSVSKLVGGNLGSVAQLINSLIGKKLVVTFEIK